MHLFSFKSYRSLRGFTLLEMLVSMLIFSLVMLAVYKFFDQGQWMYLQSERRALLQDNARLALEAMERDVRMAGFGVPSQTEVGSGLVWLPYIFEADVNRIYFKADIDSRNSLTTADVATSDTTVDVPSGNAALVCDGPSNGIILVKRGRRWDDTLCSGTTATTITISPGAAGEFPVEETEIYTPEHVFFKLDGDADNDGVCDSTTEPFCELQRAVVYGNTVLANDSTLTETDWESLATNIRTLDIRYFTLGGAEIAPPLSGLNLFFVERIVVTVTGRARSSVVQQYQDFSVSSEILVRKSIAG